MDALKKPIQAVLEMPVYKDKGFTAYEYRNPAYIVSLLYCLIVVPKEIWSGGEADPLYEKISNDSVAKFRLVVPNNNWKKNLRYWLIHYLRNSISHANYSVDESMQFVFWNEPNGLEKPNWQVVIDGNNLMFFLSEVGSLLANAVLTK